MTHNSSISDHTLENFVLCVLRDLKCDADFGQICQKAMESQCWKSLKNYGDAAQLVATRNDQYGYPLKPIHLIIMREYNMEEKLLRVPSGAIVMYIIYKFKGNIPPRPCNSIVKYRFCDLTLSTWVSNDLVYRWSMPVFSGLSEKMTVGNVSSIKEMQKKGYDLKYAEAYDPNEYVYDCLDNVNLHVGIHFSKEITKSDSEALYAELVSAQLALKNMPFYRYVLEKLTEYDHEKTDKNLLDAIQKAMENIGDWKSLDEKDDAVYYYSGMACVCIKHTYGKSGKHEQLKLGYGEALVLVNEMYMPIASHMLNNMAYISGYCGDLINKGRSQSNYAKSHINKITQILN